MIVPSLRLYHYAVKRIWKPMLVKTLVFWAFLIGSYYLLNGTSPWNQYGWWLLPMIGGTYFLLMDVRLACIMLCHQEKKKWRKSA